MDFYTLTSKYPLCYDKLAEFLGFKDLEVDRLLQFRRVTKIRIKIERLSIIDYESFFDSLGYFCEIKPITTDKFMYTVISGDIFRTNYYSTRILAHEGCIEAIFEILEKSLKKD